MNCPACGFNINKDFRFCPSCGQKLSDILKEKEYSSGDEQIVICDVCGEENSASSIYCNSCGAKLDRKLVGKNERSVIKNQESKPGRQEPKKYKEKANLKTEIKSNKPSVETQINRMSTVNIIVLVVGLVLLGYVILDISGVFDSPINKLTSNNNSGITNDPGTAQINLSDLERINELEKIVISDSTRLEQVLELAHKLGDSGLNERAVKYYEMYLRQNPNNADVNVDLGVVYFELKQYNRAKNRMMKGLALNPAHQIALFNIGVVNSSEGKLDSAKIWWKKAVEINPATEIGRRAQELLNTH